ncbi:Cytochrome b6-f complex iron-sulfur subunit 1 [Microbacterium lemovicicum]|uniref:Cytochrome b6-f complex iron-sulfur subunit 1 n=1 Tax=Microbacterium lemovicicum TaxID=1072463 RepID=A0A3Q9IWL8_9MICO|nr:FAD-dependent oxidoreductase [Microbacterium lemovicicum]AZS36018.1 Cytochrome b6-f complex iron-sulfur subunit 1 [Microbacterium lemovicicum]
MESLWRTGTPRITGTPFAPGSRSDVVVVGAGLTGLATALMLQRAGRTVTVIEAGEVAQLATGGNTGKLSLLQGSVLSTLRRHHYAALVKAYVDANRAGMEWLTGFAEEAGVPFTRRTAYSYAQTDAAASTVDDEFDAAREAGLDVRRVDPDALDVPFPVAAAIALNDQVALDPARIAGALAEQFVAAGGSLHTGLRVTKVHTLPDPRVDTPEGVAFADHIVLATGAPIADRGLYFAKTSGLRSYCVSFATDRPVPDGLLLSVDGPTRSIRSVTTIDGPVAGLIVGGNGHPVGRSDSERAAVDDLVDWTRRYFPEAVETHRWSAQDYQSHDLIPFVGALPRGLGRIRFATGYGKWGLSNAPWAAIRLSSEILGVPWRDRPAWMTGIGTRLTVPADLAQGAVENARVGAAAAAGWAGAMTTRTPVPKPAEGEGVVATRGVEPVAISTTDGQTRAVSAVCPHLGGILSWNDAECTWDCPLHASRFAADGTRLEGPAVRDLEAR